MTWEPDYSDEAAEQNDQPSSATCKRCGKTDLEWIDCGGVPTRWRLYEAGFRGKLHICKVSADGFGEVAE